MRGCDVQFGQGGAGGHVDYYGHAQTGLPGAYAVEAVGEGGVADCEAVVCGGVSDGVYVDGGGYGVGCLYLDGAGGLLRRGGCDVYPACYSSVWAVELVNGFLDAELACLAKVVVFRSDVVVFSALGWPANREGLFRCGGLRCGGW